ncbi:MAG: double-strand break repair helicase AddA [Sphingomonas fennica]
MSVRHKRFQRLEGAQADATRPDALVWLSASAGTGKTHVLSARVLRLLLNGAPPESLLCLTFTKAGAAEMAERVQARLAAWVRLPDAKLRHELYALGEPNDDAAVAYARTLFARVLDAPGGLTIQTIHAFCQTLLAGFPLEAGLAPGFRPLEGRAEAALARRTLAELLERAEAGGDLRLIADVQALSRRLGEQRAEAYLVRSARMPAEMAALGVREGIEPRLRRALDVPAGDVEAAIEARLADDAFDLACLRSIAAANAAWGTKTGLADADRIARFLAASAAERVGLLEDLLSVALTQKGEPRTVSAKLADCDPDHGGNCARFAEAAQALLALRRRAALATLLASALRAGQAYALAWGEAKRAAGVVDFDDMIRATVALLEADGIGQWVRYKLDRRIDHILVDEAQDTNAAQWRIVRALAEEFFVEEPGEETRRSPRTLFTVGDFKQAIFGFQGTDPIYFRAALASFSAAAEAGGRRIERYSLDRSFRSTPPVLAVVDGLIEELGWEALGLFEPAERHLSARARLPGAVTLLKPIASGAADPADTEGEEGWVDDATRAVATKLAQQVKAWLDEGLMLPGKGRPLRPEDVLFLVRKRGSLASLLVARLHAEGVPVAGVDRLRLDQPLAVKDLLAACRFALQPEDDLVLANLLVSPLVDLAQDDLYAIACKRPGSLWQAVRERRPDVAELLAELLATADLVEPHRFLETLLSGPMDGRRRLLERLGPEARDPIEELLTAALGFEGEATGTLQRFLDWFDRGTVEITRDPSAPLDAVRVMTVHGAKGLQAPLVILADATADPDASRAETIAWAPEEGMEPVIVPRPRRAEMTEALADAAAAARARERAEHWRLLYVALTRAEERLVVAGALGPKMRGVPPADSWYARIEAAMAGMGAEEAADPLWGGLRHYEGAGGEGARPARPRRAAPALPPVTVPEWLHRPAPEEARPPRPLAPSAIGRDDLADPPPGPALRAAAERGRLLHALFERLPPLPPERRAEAAERWLTGAAGVADVAVRGELVAAACAILADPATASLFRTDALVEAPIAAVVGGIVVSGTVDRLIVEDDRVTVVDFKTGRRVPAGIDTAPPLHLAQVAAYAAALGVIFPGRRIEAALLYTGGPKLIALDAATLKRFYPGGEQNL